MTPTPPSGIPVAIAGQLQRDDGQDRGIRYLAVAVALLAVVGAGAIDGYPEAFAALPTATGTTTRGTPLWDVRGYHWMRVRMTDVDTTNRGAVTVLTMGGEA